MSVKHRKTDRTKFSYKNEQVAHWAFMDYLRQKLMTSKKLDPNEKLIIRDAVDGFIENKEPTGHLIATDAGCFGNNFGLYRIIVYVPWFTYKEGHVARIYTDSEYWDEVIKHVPGALDYVGNIYGIKFDYHCVKNLFELRIVDNPVISDFVSKDKKNSYWSSIVGRLWKRPDELYIGIRFAIVYSQGFRMRHKNEPGESLEAIKEECKILLKQLAGWKGMKLLIEEQGLKLLSLIEEELRENIKANRIAAEKVDELERKAKRLIDEKQAVYREAFNRAKDSEKANVFLRKTVRNELESADYNLLPNEIERINEINLELDKIRAEIGPYVHEKSLTDGKIQDLSCKSAITRYAIDFFVD